MLDPIVKQLELTAEQQPAVTTLGSDIFVSAGAGSGKTRTLIARMLHLMGQGHPLRSIAAITFTTKAAREMRNRLRRYLTDYLQGELPEAERHRWNEQLQQLDGARIGTIHSLCAEILRNHPVEAEIDPRFTVMDETTALLMRTEVVEAALGIAADDETMEALYRYLPPAQLGEALTTLLKNRLRGAELLDESFSPKWDMQISAAFNNFFAHSVTRSTLDNLLNLRRNGVLQRATTSGKPSAAGQSVLRFLANVEQAQALVEEMEWEAAAAHLHHTFIELNLAGNKNKEISTAANQLREVFKQTVKKLVDPATTSFALNAELESCQTVLRTLYTQAVADYSLLKASANALDFDDLEQKAIALLEGNREIRLRWQQELSAVLVDEFQDTNRRQRSLLTALNEQRSALFMVGDAKQSIYRFRGAEVEQFLRGQDEVSRHNGLIVPLSTSYRAHPALVEILNRLLGAVFALDEGLPTTRQVPFASLTSGRHNPVLATAPYVRFLVAEGSKSAGALDAAAVLAVAEVQKVLAESQGKLDFGDVAILCRRSGAFPAYEDALEGAGIPYVVVSGQGFYRRPEIRDLLNALRAVADPTDSLALFGLLRSPAIGFADTEIYHWQHEALAAQASLWAHLGQQSGAAVEQAVTFIWQLNGLVGRVSVSDLLKIFVDESGYLAILARSGQLRSVRNVHKLLDDALQSGLFDVGEYLHYIELVTSSGAREGEARTAEGGAVQLMTVHAAKGLEFPVVILGDANSPPVVNRNRLLLDDTLGVVLKVTDDKERLAAIWQIAKRDDEAMDEAEAKRVLYVACTRAEELLIVSGTMSRNRPESGSWLKQLWTAAETGCDSGPETATDAESPSPGGWLIGGHPISCYLQPAQEETKDAGTAATPAGVEAGAGAERPFVAALVEPIPAAAAPGEEEPEIWRITRPREPKRRPPHWVVGRLVQAGLAGWVFDRPALAALLPSLAAGYGLLDRELIDAAVQRAVMLLGRLRSHPLWLEIERADQRWHGLPYSVLNEAGEVESGVIELLCRQGDRWEVLSFRSEPLAPDGWRSQVASRQPQLLLAQSAITQMTGTRPRVRTVFLDDQRMIRISDLDGESRRLSVSPAGQWAELVALADEPHRALFAACAQVGLPPAEGYADLVIGDVVAATAILLWPERRLAVADPAEQTNWGVLVRAGYHVEAVNSVTAEQLHDRWKERV